MQVSTTSFDKHLQWVYSFRPSLSPLPLPLINGVSGYYPFTETETDKQIDREVLSANAGVILN